MVIAPCSPSGQVVRTSSFVEPKLTITMLCKCSQIILHVFDVVTSKQLSRSACMPSPKNALAQRPYAELLVLSNSNIYLHKI